MCAYFAHLAHTLAVEMKPYNLKFLFIQAPLRLYFSFPTSAYPTHSWLFQTSVSSSFIRHVRTDVHIAKCFFAGLRAFPTCIFFFASDLLYISESQHLSSYLHIYQLSLLSLLQFLVAASRKFWMESILAFARRPNNSRKCQDLILRNLTQHEQACIYHSLNFSPKPVIKKSISFSSLYISVEASFYNSHSRNRNIL